MFKNMLDLTVEYVFVTQAKTFLDSQIEYVFKM